MPFAEAIFARAASSRFEIIDHFFAAILDVENLREVADFLIDQIHCEAGLAHAVAAPGIVLAHAICRRGVNRNAEFGELRWRTDNALGADLPLELRCDEVRPLSDDGLEAWIIVGQTLHPGIGLLIARKDRADPQGRANDLVGQPEQIKNLSRALADGDGAGGRLLEGDVVTAAFDCQRIYRFRSIGGGGGQNCKRSSEKAGADRQASRMKHVFSNRNEIACSRAAASERAATTERLVRRTVTGRKPNVMK